MVKRKLLLSLALLGWCTTNPARPARTQTANCDSAADIVVQAREQARADLHREQAERVFSKLKTATAMCSNSGDAWYYRHLYARFLRDVKDADYALRQAHLFSAEGLRRNLDPFASVTPAKEVKLSPVVREKWALVVGVGQYQYAGIRPLKYTAKDARDFASLLTNPNYGRFKSSNVTLLTNAEATTNRIKSEIERLGEVTGPEDLVVIYLSTHGSPRDLSSLDVNYIVTYDTNPDRLWTTSLPMVDVLKDAVRMIRAQRMAIFLDTCFSGAATLAGASLNEAAARQAATTGSAAEGGKALNFVSGVSQQTLSQSTTGSGGGVRVIITASQPNESSYESPKLQNGIFTYYLIEALKQKDGLLPINQVFTHLRDKVAQRVREEKNQIQRPMMEPPETQADIRLGIPALAK
jgi:hypothetical protein